MSSPGTLNGVHNVAGGLEVREGGGSEGSKVVLLPRLYVYMTVRTS